MKSTLVLLAHPNLLKSRINRALVESINSLPHVTVHDLYETYPHFVVDVKREQELLLAHERIVFQHPFYWYSSPALLKEWQDQVLEYGFAYGQNGIALQGKEFLSVVSAGGDAEDYRRDGQNYFSVEELLAPFQQTVRLCKMLWQKPIIFHGVLDWDDKAIAAAAEKYRSVLTEYSS